MRVIDPAGFEALFQKDRDPWNYAGSSFERHKRSVLLRACGGRVHGRVLELACANGETTRVLAGFSLRLTAVDASPTAVAEARRRTAGLPSVNVRHALLPGDMPSGPFDLIVVSEILYYLSVREADRLVTAVVAALAPGGRIVLLHHHVRFDDAAQQPGRAQERMAMVLAKKMQGVFRHRDARFECRAFRARKSRERRQS